MKRKNDELLNLNCLDRVITHEGMIAKEVHPRVTDRVFMDNNADCREKNAAPQSKINGRLSLGEALLALRNKNQNDFRNGIK